MSFTAVWEPTFSHPCLGQETTSDHGITKRAGEEENKVIVGGTGGCHTLLLLKEGASARSELHLTKPSALPGSIYPLSQVGRVTFTHSASWNAKNLN